MKQNNKLHTRRVFGLLSSLIVGIMLAIIAASLYFPDIISRLTTGGFHHILFSLLLVTIIFWMCFYIYSVWVTDSLRPTVNVRESSAHVKTKQALEESEERFRLLVENAPVGIVTFDTTGRIIDVNSKLVQIFGSPSADQTRSINVLSFPQLIEVGISGDFAECINSGKSGLFERAYVTKWGKSIFLRYNITPLRDLNNRIIGGLAIMEDFSNHKEAELELQNLNAQTQKDAATKAILLEEVNHRVKNNLAGIIGMLYATRKFVDKSDHPEDYRSTLENLIHRIEGMATVHEILTEADWSELPISDLTRQILNSVLQALPMNKKILADIQADETILISPKHAGNLGMVINELITNTIKHALADQDSTTITVRISKSDEDVLYEYHNDGPDFTEDILSLKNVNTGIYLVDTIVKNGLGGSLTLRNENGAMTRIRFKP